MDTSDPQISFDAQGRCNHCTEFLDRTARRIFREDEGRRRLEAVVAKIRKRSKGNPYDSVVGVSGGVDSCYAAYVAVSFGLRPLVVHMDNGWNSDIAVRNIKTLTERLGLDYRSFVLDWEEFRDLQLAFLKASVPEIETPTDMAIPAALHRAAAEVGVRTIVSGGNFATEGILPKAWHYNAKDVRYLKAVHRRFGTRPLRTFPTFGFLTEAYYKFVKGIRFLYILNYVPYRRKEAEAFLRREMGWRPYGGKHHESRITGFLHSYLLPVKFGIDYRRATFSTQILTGEIAREAALEALSQPPYDPERIEVEKEYLAKKFGISLEELEAIVREPPKTYRDYPNAERYLERLYRVYRRWFAGAGSS